jgi:hypothetical protein
MSSFLYRENIDSYYSKNSYYLLACIVFLGVVLRFWGLGNVCLHGDEETMAMPVLEILKSGVPLQPSGMFYPRALGQLYLMALSVYMFGVSEWALRFPSAVVGSLGVLVAFFLGKRFLRPNLNMLFVLIIAMYPLLITFSQTARMYIFFLTFLMLWAVFVFRWENNDSWKNAALAFILFLISMHFHKLTIFSSFLFFFPFLTKPSAKRFLQGLLMFFLTGVFFLTFRNWVGSKYPAVLIDPVPRSEVNLTPFKFLLITYPWLFISLLFLGLLIFFLSLRIQNKRDNYSTFLISSFLFIGAITACFFLQYYSGFLLFACGTILYLRSDGHKMLLLMILGLICLFFSFHFYSLYQSEAISGAKQVLKSMAGNPSPRIMFTFFKEFPLASFLYIAPLFYAIWKLANGSKVPDHFLFFALSVGITLLGVGFFKWGVPIRYISQVIPFFIISLLAGLYHLKSTWKPLDKVGFSRNKATLILFLIVAVMVINPFELNRAINAGYEKFPDHKGAATFMKSVQLNPKDLVLAEDILQQTYYLGKVDYWLKAKNRAKHYVREYEGTFFDIYTHTPVIGTGEDLENLLRDKNRGTMYIITNGEMGKYGKGSVSFGNGIFEVIERYNPEVIYKGRDNRTVIWSFSPLTHSQVPYE